MHCTTYTVYCPLYTVQCRLYTVHCTLYTVQFLLSRGCFHSGLLTVATLEPGTFTEYHPLIDVQICVNYFLNRANVLLSGIYWHSRVEKRKTHWGWRGKKIKSPDIFTNSFLFSFPLNFNLRKKVKICKLYATIAINNWIIF